MIGYVSELEPVEIFQKLTLDSEMTHHVPHVKIALERSPARGNLFSLLDVTNIESINESQKDQLRTE